MRYNLRKHQLIIPRIIFNTKHEDGPVIKVVEAQFKELLMFQWCLSTTAPNNCCKIGDTVVIV